MACAARSAARRGADRTARARCVCKSQQHVHFLPTLLATPGQPTIEPRYRPVTVIGEAQRPKNKIIIAWLEDELARLRQKIAKLRGERAALVKNRKRCGWHCETFLRSGRTSEGQDAVAGRTRALRSGSTQGSTEARKRARR